jgi:AcrR family transcriptional regulator
VVRGGDGESQARGDLGPLPGGHHGLSPEEVAESQRERLLSAVATLVAERGYGATTITDIAKTAAVANRVFYANFEDKEQCFLAAFDAVADHLGAVMSDAADQADQDWTTRLIAAFCAMLEFFDSEPDLARLCLVAPFTATPRVAERFREVIATGVPYLAQGRAEDGGEELPASTEDSLLGGIVAQLSRRLIKDDGPLIDLLPDLTEFALAPYLGSKPARRLAAQAAATGQ